MARFPRNKKARDIYSRHWYCRNTLRVFATDGYQQPDYQSIWLSYKITPCNAFVWLYSIYSWGSSPITDASSVRREHSTNIVIRAFHFREQPEHFTIGLSQMYQYPDICLPNGTKCRHYTFTDCVYRVSHSRQHGIGDRIQDRGRGFPKSWMLYTMF